MANPKLRSSASAIIQSSIYRRPIEDSRAHTRRTLVRIEQTSPTTVVAITIRLLHFGSKESILITMVTNDCSYRAKNGSSTAASSLFIKVIVYLLGIWGSKDLKGLEVDVLLCDGKRIMYAMSTSRGAVQVPSCLISTRLVTCQEKPCRAVIDAAHNSTSMGLPGSKGDCVVPRTRKSPRKKGPKEGCKITYNTAYQVRGTYIRSIFRAKSWRSNSPGRVPHSPICAMRKARMGIAQTNLF
jgi:hypothetical protein